MQVRVPDHMGAQEAHPVRQENNCKKQQQHFELRKLPSPTPPSTYTTQTGAEASDDRTDIVKLHTCQTLQNQCETAPKQAPQSNISKGRPPKGEIQIKICLRWTASPFNMLARKFRKLKIVPPSRKGFFFDYLDFFQKNEKMKKSIAQESHSQCHAKSHSCRTNFRTTTLGHGKH